MLQKRIGSHSDLQGDDVVEGARQKFWCQKKIDVKKSLKQSVDVNFFCIVQKKIGSHSDLQGDDAVEGARREEHTLGWLVWLWIVELAHAFTASVRLATSLTHTYFRMSSSQDRKGNVF